MNTGLPDCALIVFFPFFLVLPFFCTLPEAMHTWFCKNRLKSIYSRCMNEREHEECERTIQPVFIVKRSGYETD